MGVFLHLPVFCLPLLLVSFMIMPEFRLICFYHVGFSWCFYRFCRDCCLRHGVRFPVCHFPVRCPAVYWDAGILYLWHMVSGVVVGYSCKPYRALPVGLTDIATMQQEFYLLRKAAVAA